MRSRRFAAALAVAATACGGAGDAATAPIDLVLVADAEEVVGYEQLVAEFEADTGIEVRLTPFARKDDLLARLTTSLSGSNPPDLFLVNWRSYGQFVAAGAVEPAQRFLEESDAVDLDAYFDAPLDAFRYDGETLACMPQNASSLVVYYNADLFEASGVPLPHEGWTWDDLLAAAEALTDGDTYGLGVEPSLIRLAPFVWSNGGELVDDPLRPGRLTLESGPAREALDWFLDLQLVHGVVPPDAEEQAESSESRFLRGELGMFLNSRVAVPTLRTIDGFRWDAGPLPAPRGGSTVTELHTDAYCIARRSDAHDAAWRFVEFAASPRGQEILTASGRLVPSRREVAGSPVFLEPDAPPANAEVYLDNLERARVSPTVGSWPLVEEVGDAILADTFYGRIDREEGIARLHAETDPLFEQVPNGS